MITCRSHVPLARVVSSDTALSMRGSAEQVQWVKCYLLEDRRIARATHGLMLAYRFTDARGLQVGIGYRNT